MYCDREEGGIALYCAFSSAKVRGGCEWESGREVRLRGPEGVPLEFGSEVVGGFDGGGGGGVLGGGGTLGELAGRVLVCGLCDCDWVCAGA